MRGPLWFPLQALLGLAGISFFVIVLTDCRTLKGAKLFEAKMVAGGLAFVTAFLSFRGALRSALAGTFLPLTAGLVGVIMLGFILSGTR
jgi:hypothetical protein